jgi:hypothetical protein
MAKAKGVYEDRFKGAGNFIRLMWRKAGVASEVIDPWLQLIPNEFGMSVVRGAFTIIFHVCKVAFKAVLMAKMAAEAAKKEEKIFNAFETLTDTIISAASRKQSFHGNGEMHRCSEALYVALLHGVKDLIWTLNPKVEGTNPMC